MDTKIVFLVSVIFVSSVSEALNLDRFKDDASNGEIAKLSKESHIYEIRQQPNLETEPIILKRVKRRRGGIGRSRSRSGSRSRDSSWNPFKRKKPRTNPVPANSYPKQKTGPSGYPGQPSRNIPTYNANRPPPAGWNIPSAGQPPKPKFSGGFPSPTYGRGVGTGAGLGYGGLLAGGLGRGGSKFGIANSLSRGGTGRGLGAGLLGAGLGTGLGLFGGYQLAKLMMYQPRPGWGSSFVNDHDHYHDEHGHYLGPDGVYYDHANRFVHDARDFLPPGAKLEGFNDGDPLDGENRTLLVGNRYVRFYPQNGTTGIFEYSNKSVVLEKFQQEQKDYYRSINSSSSFAANGGLAVSLAAVLVTFAMF